MKRKDRSARGRHANSIGYNKDGPLGRAWRGHGQPVARRTMRGIIPKNNRGRLKEQVNSSLDRKPRISRFLIKYRLDPELIQPGSIDIFSVACKDTAYCRCHRGRIADWNELAKSAIRQNFP